MKKIIIYFCLFNCLLIHSKGAVYIEAGPGDLFDIVTERNRDNVRRPFYEMREALRRLGYSVVQPTSFKNLKNVEKIVCFDVQPRILKDLQKYPLEKLILFLWEPPTVNQNNYDKKFHRFFSKVYTWDDDLVDNKKYFKFYEPQPCFDMLDEVIPFEEKRLSVLMTYNKTYAHPLSLSYERRKVISFFEQFDEDQFDLYGPWWPKGFSKNYHGFAPSKVECMKHYKFCFCYENMRGLNGYITGEKIFNVFIAGCVPIYWGAENIKKYIPANCFIDRRDFGNYEELYLFLKDMSNQEHRQYLENIRNFLQSAQALQFSTEHFVHIFLTSVEPDYDKTIALTQKQQAILSRLLPE
jgi:alpha(1,3/1,4) fucosyltransferase